MYAKTVIYRRICLGHTSEKFMVSVQHMVSDSQVLVFHFTAPFSGCLKRLIWNLVEHLKLSYFCEILNCFKLLTITQKKLIRRCSNGLKRSFWLKVWSIEFNLVPSLQIKPRKYSTGKYGWHHFSKGESLWWESKQNECLCRSSCPKGSFTKVLWEI